MYKKVLILIISIMIFSCNKKETKNNLKILNIGYTMEPLTLDPSQAADPISFGFISSFISTGLMRVKDNGDYYPGLAISYRCNLLEYEFTLRNNLKWSDGHPLTAHDFEKGWKKIISPDFLSKKKQFLFCIKNAKDIAHGKKPVEELGVKAIDDNTLIVQLEYPTPYFLKLLSHCIFSPIPSHLEKNEKNYVNEKVFINNGPFILENWTQNHQIILKKNPYYWNASRIYLDKININFIPHLETAYQMFFKQKLDYIGGKISTLTSEEIDVLKKKKLKFVLKPTGDVKILGYNIEKFPFNNKNIRKALSCAIDRRTIVKNITLLNEPIATRFIVPILVGNKKRFIIKNNCITMAIDLFEKGLKELNTSRDKIIINISHDNTQKDKQICEYLKEIWEKIFNIKVNLKSMPLKTFAAKVYSSDFQMILSTFSSYFFDATAMLNRFRYKKDINNYLNWESKKYKKLLDESNYIENQEQRYKILNKLENILEEEMPFVPLYYKCNFSIIQPYVNGVSFYEGGNILCDKLEIDKEEKEFNLKYPEKIL